MTELEKLIQEKKEIEKKIKDLTGSTSGLYVRFGQLRFGLPSKRALRNHAQFELSILTQNRYENKALFKTFARYSDIINTKSGIQKLITDLNGILVVIDNEIDKWVK